MIYATTPAIYGSKSTKFDTQIGKHMMNSKIAKAGDISPFKLSCYRKSPF
jgi:hypothetical protein